MHHTIKVIPPFWDEAIVGTIFTQRFLPEFCGMSAEEYEKLDNNILSGSIRNVFFPRVLKELYRDYRADIAAAFVDAMPTPPDGKCKAGLELILYDDPEPSFKRSLLDGILSVMDNAEELTLRVSDSEPNTIHVENDLGIVLLVWHAPWNAWELLKNFVFLPERVKPRIRDGILL